ncbi:minor capsid protein [uncultured Megasphaera sp.]|uniref:minor capsid protein n=1 Tax=uncultured Megasphaera sp. TaxID=165188 RepID=UPI00288C3853|nr:minor capsid protein [uncultured Megasphaera sp.]
MYEDSVYKTAYETQKLRGEYSTFREVAKRDIETAISKPWATDGKDFSTRIWENKAQLINTLQTEMTRSFMIGEGAAPLINRIQKRFNVSFSNARRLVETETAYVQEKGMLDTYEALDVEQYQILAVLDMKTSDICRHLDKKVFDKKDAKPGITAPPFHCYCRSTTTPYIDGITDGTGDTRAVRDPVTGKTVFVESDLSYEEWYNKYVKNTDTGALIGLKTSNGITIAKLSKHPQERADIRNLDLDGIRDALINPLHVGEVVVKENGNSQRFIGETTTVNINPDTGVVITSWPTGKSRLKKYKKGK